MESIGSRWPEARESDGSLAGSPPHAGYPVTATPSAKGDSGVQHAAGVVENTQPVPVAAEGSDVARPANVASESPAVVTAPRTRLNWLICVILFLLVVRYFVPWFAEEVQYAITRGKLRAEHDHATQELAGQTTQALSMAGQRVAKRIAPSVVHISIKLPAESTEESTRTWFRPPFAIPRQRLSGQGSGVIVDAAGYILTNHHVVKEASEITVRLSDGRRVPAQLVSHDPMTDLALLKIHADRLIPAEWGDSEGIEVGSLVWAVGSPFGFEHSLTSGIISAKHRGGLAGTPHQDFLQTDVPVNPGNSGGPLVDEWGRVVGINTAIVGEVYQGVSFAIPSHIARSVFEQLRQEGKVKRGWLGVQMDEVSDSLAEQLKLDKPYGALVVQVVEIEGHSPAREAGIQEGDVIVAWNDQEVTSPATLSQLVAGTLVGTTARVRVRRGTEWLDLPVRVGQHPLSR